MQSSKSNIKIDIGHQERDEKKSSDRQQDGETNNDVLPINPLLWMPIFPSVTCYRLGRMMTTRRASDADGDEWMDDLRLFGQMTEVGRSDPDWLAVLAVRV